MDIFKRLKGRPRDIAVTVGFLVVAAFLVAAGVMAWRHFMESPPYVDPVRYPVRGIDISAHNGAVDLQKAADAGIQFAFIKASEGVDFRDSLFPAYYSQARLAGLKIGAYHFFRFDKDGIDQARNLVSSIGGRHLDLGVAIDVEDNGNVQGVDSALIAHRLVRMAEFLNLVGYRVTFYSNKNGYSEYLRQAVPGSTLWICSFSPNPINTEWTFWQYDHHGRVDGLEGDVDLNVFCGSEAEWDNYLKGALWPYNSLPG